MNGTTDGRLSTSAREAGFSLIELLVVMVITFFIAGAIYGLLASGQNAFRKEPELADRQQNIRAAMDMITKDISNAGAGLPAFAQVFTITDPAGGVGALNGSGPAGSMGAPAQALRSADLTANSDLIEMIEADERCPALTVCSVAPAAGAAGLFLTREGRPQCTTDASLSGGMAFLSDNLNVAIQPIPAQAGGATVCPGAPAPSYNGGVTVGAAVQVGTNPTTPAVTAPYFLVTGRVVRYVIAPDADLAPTLWRSVTGRFNPGAATISAMPGNAWQPVARGIEDMQVEYMDSGGVWMNAPNAAVPCVAPAGPCTVAASYAPIVRQVRVTLSARVIGPAGVVAQGASTAAGTGPAAIRGQMVSVTQPRAAMVALELGDQVR